MSKRRKSKMACHSASVTEEPILSPDFSTCVVYILKQLFTCVGESGGLFTSTSVNNC